MLAGGFLRIGEMPLGAAAESSLDELQYSGVRGKLAARSKGGEMTTQTSRYVFIVNERLQVVHLTKVRTKVGMQHKFWKVRSRLCRSRYLQVNTLL